MRSNILCCLITTMAWPAAAADEVGFLIGGARGVVVGPVDDKHPYQSEGSTIRLKDGGILHAFIWRSLPEPGQKFHPHYVPTVIAKAVTRDGGRTWSAPEPLLHSATRTASHPSLARLANGELAITYNKIAGEMEAVKVFRYSKDEGKTWSDEILISPSDSYWTSAHDRMVVLSNGRIVHPLHHKEVLLPERIATHVVWSDDNGRTWKRGQDRLIVEEVVAGRPRGFGFWEVSVAERADGSLFMIGRTRAGYLYHSISKDRGETWTRPERSQLLSSEAPARVERIPGSNDLLLIWNSCCLDPADGLLGRRLTLSSVISSDGGMTWRGRREVASVAPDPGGGDGVAYPSIYIDGETVYVGYFARRNVNKINVGPQYVAAMPLSWFYVELRNHHPEAVAGRLVR